MIFRDPGHFSILARDTSFESSQLSIPHMTEQHHNAPPSPFGRSYWVVPGTFLAGFFPGSRDPDEALRFQRALVDCGVTYVLNLMEPDERNSFGEPFPPYDAVLNGFAAGKGADVVCDRRAIRDMDVLSREEMAELLDRIDRAIAAGRTVYVHCWGGLGRTGTVVGCWLARHGIATGTGALQKIRELRWEDAANHIESPQTAAQRAMVMSWGVGE
jgi:hypothetical protein